MTKERQRQPVLLYLRVSIKGARSRHFSKVIALETAEFDITINTICPSYVKTPLVDKQIKNQAQEHGISEEDVINEIMLKPMPKKAFISIEEISKIVQFLIDDGAKNITGQTITVDGGWTLS